MNYITKKLTLYYNILRLNKPTGFMLLMLPCLWSLAFASNGAFELTYILTFIVGAILMRGAGCIINDIFDREIDKHVERTKNRPLASGKLNVHEAFILAIIISLISFFMALNYLPFSSIIIALLSIPLIIFYPVTKRFFILPQLVLGITFNIGVFVAWMCYKPITITTIILYIACIFWTLGYDSVYALSDVDDDIKQGLLSGPILFGKHTDRFILFSYTTFSLLLMIIGIINQLGILFYITCIVYYLLLIRQYIQLRKNKANYQTLFSDNVLYGAAFWVILLFIYNQ